MTAPAGAPSTAERESFRAHDRKGRSVVLDCFPAGDAALRRLKRIADTTARTSLPGVCRILEVATWVDRTVVVREDRGESLRQRCAGQPMEPRDVVRLGIKLAAALETAHAARLIHGSLAADFVFVSADGEDLAIGGFGYAGLLRGEPGCAAPETQREGPETRSDVYAAGAVLWEMVTGETPPADPLPATQLRQDLPLLLDGIIRTAMDPAPGRRYANAAGLGKALKLFLEGEASPARLERARSHGVSGRRHRKKRRKSEHDEAVWAVRVRWLKRLAWLCAIATAVFAAFVLLPRTEPFGRRTVNRLTDFGDVIGVAISPDGSHLAVVRAEPDGQSLWTQPTARRHPTRLTPTSTEPLSGVSFSRDGATIYYVRGKPGVLHAISIKGGAPRTYRSDLLGASVSPDESKVAFLRKVGDERTVSVSNLDGTADAVAYSRQAPADLRAVAWAPSGKLLAVSVFAPGEGTTLTTCHPDGAYAQHLGWWQWPGDVSMTWLARGEGLILAGPEAGGANPLWRVRYPEGEARTVSGLADYSAVSLTANGKILASVRTDRDASLFVAPVNFAATPQQLTKGDRPDGVGGVDWVDGRTLVFATSKQGARSLWTIAIDNREEKYVVAEPDRPVLPRVSPDGKLVAYIGLGKQGNRIWLVGPDGKGLRDPYRTGLQTAPSFSPDGQTLYFAFPMAPWLSPPDPAQYGVWKATVEGGRPERITPDPADDAVVSPDGRLIAYRTSVSGDPEVRVIPVAGGEPVAHILMPESGPIGWTPDSQEIVWARSESSVANLWAHSITHTAQRQITRFTAPGEIYSFAWSRDGKWIAVSRGRPRGDVVMFNDQSWW